MTEEVLDGDVEDLKVKAIIGFDGTAIDGLRQHPNGHDLLFPLGNKVSILHWGSKRQDFLSGHTNIVSAIDISSSGKYVASGQINHIGFKALVIVWDFETRTIYTKHEVHKVRIEAVSFTLSDRYLISLGGRDCSNVIIWDLEMDKPLCCAPASKGTQGQATCIKVTNRREPCFVSAGDGTLTVWKIDHEARKLHGTDVNMSKLKRNIICMTINDKDEVLYCGTTTGDIMKIKLNYHHDAEIMDPTSTPVMFGCYALINLKPRLPQDKIQLFGNGVRAILIIDKGILLVGAGDGTLTLVEEVDSIFKSGTIPIGHHAFKLPSTPQLKMLKQTTVYSMVTSIVRMDEKNVLVGTVECEIYSVCLKTFERNLLVTCHTSTIYCVAFPHEFSEVFATASKNDVRIWNIQTMQELLRIKVENFSCSGVVFAHNGKAIITSWNDGIIRSFTPLTGQLMYAILNAHNKGVSAIALTKNDKTIISGGCEGQVRVWDVSPYHQKLVCTLKEHKGPVSAIHINKFDDEAVSSSTDGTCIIWDIVRQCRKQILFANALFMCVKFYPTGVQIITGDSDRKIAYWEVFDGTLIREIEASQSNGVNSLDISPDGGLIVSGGNDEMVKIWKYQEGFCTHVGLGHAAVITAVLFSPDSKYIVTCCASGSIFVWDNPFKLEKTDGDDNEADKKDKSKKNGNEEHISDSGSAKQKELQKKKCKCLDPKRCQCQKKPIKK